MREYSNSPSCFFPVCRHDGSKFIICLMTSQYTLNGTLNVNTRPVVCSSTIPKMKQLDMNEWQHSVGINNHLVNVDQWHLGRFYIMSMERYYALGQNGCNIIFFVCNSCLTIILQPKSNLITSLVIWKCVLTKNPRIQEKIKSKSVWYLLRNKTPISNFVWKIQMLPPFYH